jgi:hypothetical protein
MWYDAAYRNPTIVDPTVFDGTLNPGAAAWFKTSAQHVLVRIDGIPGDPQRPRCAVGAS